MTPSRSIYSPEVEELLLWLVGSRDRFRGPVRTWDQAERAGLIEKGKHGTWIISEKGRELLRRGTTDD